MRHTIGLTPDEVMECILDSLRRRGRVDEDSEASVVFNLGMKNGGHYDDAPTPQLTSAEIIWEVK